MTGISTYRCCVLAGLLTTALSGASLAADDWYPLTVNATKVDGSKGQFDYIPLSASGKASKKWSICSSFPHLKDPVFVSVNYGMVEEARRLGVDLKTYDAGGYGALANQISQIENCVAAGADAVIMVAIAEDGMNNLLMELKEKGIPVIDAFNGVNSPNVAARVLTNPRDQGFRAGEYLAAQHPAGTQEVKVAWLPGPAGAGFVTAFDDGFKAGIAGSAVTIVETKNGDLGKEIQSTLVEDILQTHDDLDYIAGTAVMAEAAVPILKARGIADKIKLVSVYTTPGVYEYVKNGDVEIADGSTVTLTARIMLDEAVRALEDKIEYTEVYTIGKVYTTESAGSLDLETILAPADFAPVFNLSN
ncbi:TMAO reductase system periplasmic protein TorT [Frigidibacter sp. SD6-1]|uniref:TMAO reductase system periplasmic protein TorT n=1 Tax=Frigidibacter sp. SD6-1 TaxID=3032581 RepID=UPI0024DF499D|nr:TMAO reductase system periplasmic protein TorT [Frigidibacter sp. SD6-1]